MNNKMIIVDLDGTLLHNDKSISDYTLEKLIKCKKKGYKLMVCTSRALRHIKKYDDVIKFDMKVVSNGGRLLVDGRVIEHRIDFESAKRILSILDNYPSFRISIETGDKSYSNVDVNFFDTIISNNLMDVIKNESILKIVIGIDGENSVEIIKEYLSNEVYYTIAQNSVIQIMSKNASKYNGIVELFNIINFDIKDSIYFGDDYDDIKPIMMCGVGVAMSNGIYEVKNVSDYVTCSNEEDGVAKYISEFILKE